MKHTKNQHRHKKQKKNKKSKKQRKLEKTLAKSTKNTKQKVKSTTYQAGAWNRYMRLECHKGNNLLFAYGEKGAGLYIGGWRRLADPEPSWAVIDLSGDGDMIEHSGVKALNLAGRRAFATAVKAVHGRRRYGPWLSLPIRDYGTPFDLERPFWLALANDIKVLMESGTNVFVACYGGHGRSGMVACILTGLLRPDLTADSPIAWIREVYCDEAVETRGQELYIYRMLDIIGPSKAVVSEYSWTDYRTANTVGKDVDNVGQPLSATQVLDRDNVSTEDNVVHRWEYDDGIIVTEYTDGTFAASGMDDPDDILGECESERCTECGGLGYVTKRIDDYKDDPMLWEETELCPKCDGFGVLPRLLKGC